MVIEGIVCFVENIQYSKNKINIKEFWLQKDYAKCKALYTTKNAGKGYDKCLVS